MNTRTLRAALTLAAFLTLASGCESTPLRTTTAPAPTTATAGYAQEVFAQGLDVPWDLAIVPDGRMFVTERPGTIRVIENGVLAAEPVLSFKTAGTPFQSKGESGLLGITADPDFARNHYLYVYHTYEENGGLRNRVIRLVERNNKATIDKVLMSGMPGQSNHDGGRIRFGPDGKLYFTIGDAQVPMQSQDLNSRAGKIMRIEADGSIPKDNPFPSSPVYSWGHRNPQGLAWHPVTKQLFSSEHGQSAHDEINLIEPGANYGWPLIEGDETVPKPGSSSTANIPMRPPIVHSGTETWAPSGMTFVQQGPWKGALLVANLRGQQLLKLTLNANDPSKVDKLEKLYRNEWGRLRSVTEGPDGALYILTNNRDGRGDPKPGDDKIIRLRPAANK